MIPEFTVFNFHRFRIVKSARSQLYRNPERIKVTLDGRNRARVIAESLARVIAAIRITSVRWRSYLPLKTESGPRRPCVRCVVLQIARLAFVGVACVLRGAAEWPARIDCVRCTLPIGNWRFGPSKKVTQNRLKSDLGRPTPR